jgi:alanyl-tRNA synthetase
VIANDDVLTTVEDLEAAKARGVTAMFGEKYEDRVRVLDVGGWSTELCGGTHVRAAGDIGPFVIVSERAVAAGVRRIEALTGPAAVAEVQRQRRVLREAAASLKTAPDDVPARVEQLQAQIKEARKKEKAQAGADVGQALERVRGALAQKHGYAAAALDLPELDARALRELGDRVKSLGPDLALGLFGRDGDKAPFLIACRGAARERGLDAGALAKELAPLLGGGGGGRPDQAQGQGQRPDAVPQAVKRLAEAFDSPPAAG